MRTYMTVSGDTFDKISLKFYGSEYLFPFLLKENPKYRMTVVFSAGVLLKIPDLEMDDESESPDWLDDEGQNLEVDETGEFG